MKNSIFLLVFLLLIFSFNLTAQVVEQWVQRYNGSGNGLDEAYSIAADASGNVYVTGRSYAGPPTYADYATIKYNSSGVQQWIERYNGPGNSDDIANSLAIDGSGNVYVIGSSPGSGTYYDFATLKYNSLGVQQWVSRYNGPANFYDYGYAIAVDGSGNVYVTGVDIAVGSNTDYATLRYNSMGVQQWVSRYTGNVGSDYTHSIAVDGLGNVYITGESPGGVSGYDYATIKYNSFGVEQWVQRYNGPGNSFDLAYSLAIDGSGNVYVTGGSVGTSYPDYDYATVKYNSSGVEQWVQRYNGPGNNLDQANSLAIDFSGNVYVTGQSRTGSTSGTEDFATIKYNSSGVQQWVARYNGPGNSDDYAYSLAVDVLGNVYVTGQSRTGIQTGTADYATVKYNSEGVQIWVQRYNGPGNGFDQAETITVDASGNVYVTGSSYGGSGTSNDYATIKYVQTPTSSPNLFSPPNNSQGWGAIVLLVWYRVSNAANYRVQASTDSLFGTLILNDSTVTDSTKGVGGLQNNTWYYWRVAANNAAGTGPWSAIWRFRTGFVGIHPIGNEMPKEFKLYDNYPNPFNPATKIRFELPVGATRRVALTLFDALGREIETLVNQGLSPGTYEVDWDASNYPSGVYFYKLSAGDFTETRKMILLK